MPTSARTLLFVPADNRRRLERAWSAPADALIADLEDAVGSDAKAAAREELERQLAAGPPRASLCLRVNAPDHPEAAADLALVARNAASIDAVVIPKASVSSLAGAELPVPAIALIETAGAVLDAAAIATAPGVARLMLGSVDLSAELGVELSLDAPILRQARVALALASAAARLPGPIDGVWTDLGDEAGLRAETRAARATGFTAKACIHPDQLGPVAEELAPGQAQLAWARGVVGAAERAGDGAIVFDGQMIDPPVVKRARRLLHEAGSGTA